MSHHGHDHSVPSLKDINRAFYIGIALNSIFTLIEFVAGYYTNSLALISDASHNLSDVASLIISLIGMKLAQKTATYLYTYGYKKASILASLINSVLLIFIVVKIFVEAISRLGSQPEVLGSVVIITAIIGVIINSISALLFYKGQRNDINLKGAFIHMMVDTLVSVGVVVSGIIIHYTSWDIVDSITSFVIGFVILITTWSLLKESLRLTLDGIPKDINKEEIKAVILSNKSVENLHHLHIWALSSTENAITVLVILKKEVNINEIRSIKKDIKHNLEHHNIQHSTIEVDSAG